MPYTCLQGAQSNARGGPFAVINGSLAQDALVLSFPANSCMTQPLYLLHISTAAPNTSSSNGGGPILNASVPRLLVNLAAGAITEIVEEHVSATADGAHVSMPVAEVVLAENAVLKHGYVNREAQGASHFKATLVTQVSRGRMEVAVSSGWPVLVHEIQAGYCCIGCRQVRHDC